MAGILPTQSIYQLMNITIYNYFFLWFQIYAKSPNQTGVIYTTQRFQTTLCRKFIQSKHIK